LERETTLELDAKKETNFVCPFCNSIQFEKSKVCHDCHNEFEQSDLDQYEYLQIMKSMVAYQSQDLICLKCKQMKIDSFSRYCKCSGEYRLDEDIIKTDFFE
jgi:hypothetical protein